MKKVLYIILFVLLISMTSSYSEEPARFRDNGDGTITDTLTDLMWIKSPEPLPMNLKEAVEYIKKINTGSHKDWRLPSQDELWSLHKGMSMDDNPAEILAKHGFNIKSYYYWTSTSCVNPDCKDKGKQLKCADDPNCMMSVSMGDYAVVGYDKKDKILLLPVRTAKGK